MTTRVGRSDHDEASSEPPPFHIEVVEGGTRPVLHLSGDLDRGGAGALTAAVDELPPLTEGLALDMADVPFVDSSGLSALIHAIRRTGADGGMLTIRRPTPLLVRLLETTGVDVHLVIEPEQGQSAT